MLLAHGCIHVVPAETFNLLGVALVLGVDHHNHVIARQDDVRQEGALRSE